MKEFNAEQVKQWIKERESGDASAQSKIDEMMKNMPKAGSKHGDHDMAEFNARYY